MRPLMRLVFILALLPAAASATVTVVDDGGAAPPRVPHPGDPAVPYLVITDRRLQGAFMQLVHARTQRGLNATVVTLQSIENSYPAGVDLAERVRLLLRDAHANWGTRWVLLGGDASVVPIRGAHLRLGGILGDIDLPTDQYYACLDGSWNADGDGLWGENPRPEEPGDDVDFFPELFVGRAPVRTPAEASAFVRRTLEYVDRLESAPPRSALLAAEVLGAAFDLAPDAERLRPALEANPSRSVVRLYENASAWPGALQLSRPVLLEALNGSFDLTVLLGAGGRGVFLAGQDPVDRVTSQDLLGLTNAPRYQIVYAMSAWTTAPGDPLSIGNALLRARSGGAVAVLGTTDVQFVIIGVEFMNEFFDRALAATPIGEALAGTVADEHAQRPQTDGYRLTTQGMLLLGDPALLIDPPSSSSGSVVSGGTVAPKVRPVARDLAGATLAIAALAGESFRAGRPAVTSTRHVGETRTAQARVEGPLPSLARTTTRMRFELPSGTAGAYEVDVFDVSGHKIRALANGRAAPGIFALDWDLRSDSGARVPTGVYFVRLQFAETSVTHRVVVLR